MSPASRHVPRTRSLAALAAVAALTVGVAAPSQAAGNVPAIPGLSAAAVEIMNSAPYANGQWAVRVVDVTTGEVLVDYNSNVLVEPASVTKTYSVGAAWLKFGADHRIVTPVVRTGPVRTGVLSGDLVLVAKGDITMGGQTGPDGRVVFTDLDHNDANLLPGATIAGNNPLAGLDRLARQVKASGIDRVGGDVIVDDRLFVTRDLGENDGPVSPIVINNNLIDLVTTPTSPGKPAKVRMRPVVAPWSVDNKVRTVRSGGTTAIDISADEATGVITLRGTIAAEGAPALKVWHMSDPATFARTAFVQALTRAGVQVDAPVVQANSTIGLPSQAQVDKRPRVARLVGLAMSENARYILKVSYNRGAQTMVCLLAAAAGSRECDDGLAAMAPIFTAAGIDPLGASLVDGSGLVGNLVTAASQTQLQRAFAARPDAARWRDALPIMGVDGSVATVQKNSPAAGHVFAKTGTLGAADLLNLRLRVETKALGGYITAKSGRQLAIAIVGNNAMFADIYGVFAANEDLGEIATEIWASY
jgi:D-alanyl-D-alanine carboxypeptidase/D-alanyl-D-alanine-endopeptidase (penicillin-binding protein 4)